MLSSSPLATVVTDPGSLTLIALVGLAYATGLREWRTYAGRPVVTSTQRLMFWAGLAVTGVAVASPLDSLSARTMTAHMAQHVLLLNVAGPLFALGAPVPTLLWALPASWRRRALRASRRLTRSHDRWQVAWVAATLLVEGTVLIGWHFPALYDAALHNQAVHLVEHLTLLLTSTVSWWAVATGRRSRRGAAAVAALVGSLSGIVLGSAMVVIPHPLYPPYVHGLGAAAIADAVADQRMAGVIMWAFGGLLEDITGAALFASWLAMTHERPEESYAVPPLPGVPS